MGSFWNDLGFATRTLRKNPAFALTAILTLALGIGATTAIFSVVNTVLLRPLPYDHPERLAIIWGELRTRKVYDWSFAPGDFKDLSQLNLFEGIAAVRTNPGPLTIEGATPQQIQIATATPNIFSVLGVKVANGRGFTADDGIPQAPLAQAAPGAAPAGPPPPRLPRIGVMSDGFWRRVYGADPSIIGKNIQIQGGPTLIVGVLKPGVELLFPPKAGLERVPDVWVAARINFDADVQRNNVGLFAVARLEPTTTLAAANAQVEQLSASLRDRFPLKKSVDLHFRVESMKENVVASVKPTIRALMGAVVFVLLIACANVANLMLVRVSQRERELAVRAAIGGSQWMLTRQLLAESLVLSITGGVLGVALAAAGIRALLALAPADLPRIESVAIDPLVLGFTMAACIVSAFVFGLGPAVRASRPDLQDVLRAGGRGMTPGNGALLRKGVVAAEVALSFVLLIGCGLMIRSAIELQRVDPGFDPKGVLTMRVGNLRTRSDTEQVAKMASIEQRLRGLPGVSNVAVSTTLPLENRPFNGRWGTSAALGDPTKYRQAQFHVVSPSYFETMHTKLIAGRTFGAAENLPGSKAIMIDERVAALAFPNESPIGKTLLARISTPEAETYQVIGVIKHHRHTTLVGDEKESIFFPDGAQGSFSNAWILKTSGDPAALATSARAALLQLDPQLLITEMRPISELVDRAMAPTRFALALITAFAVLAGLLAAIGLYGVLSSLVRQRVPEIGVRLAFGAQPSSIFRLVLQQGLSLSAIGVGIGLVGAFALTRTMVNLLVNVQATDPLTFAGMIVVFFVISALACWLPARRAANVHPNVALREG
jgi:putative ABC transport system permease protein